MWVADLAMTWRISLVAVCCSRASFVSLNSRTFSMAMTAWSAKVCSRATCRSVKSPASLRRRAVVLERPAVRVGEDGVGGKGVQQARLPLGEEPGLGAAEHDRAGRD